MLVLNKVEQKKDTFIENINHNFEQHKFYISRRYSKNKVININLIIDIINFKMVSN